MRALRALPLILTLSILVPKVAFAVPYVELPTDHQYAKLWRIMVTGDQVGASRRMGQTVLRPANRGTSLTPASKGFFGDVAEDHPNYAAILYMVQQGMMDLMSGRMFKPLEPITRGQFTAIVANRVFSDEFIEGCFENISFPYPSEYSLLFDDMPKEGEDAKRVCAALMAGVVHGYDNTTFRPDQIINFAEAAKITTRAYDVSFLPYRGEGKEWFKLYVTSLAENGGIPLSIKKFDSQVTRAEAAEILYRADAGITNLPSRSYKDLMVDLGKNVVETWMNWMM
ncbi:MAG TPA: S-layer homology domain-containing protein [Candidatus Peribacterales bacterium]|nr:S-layer homology domain-containing protein [Candidatus Peribacterales bacterium]